MVLPGLGAGLWSWFLALDLVSGPGSGLWNWSLALELVSGLEVGPWHCIKSLVLKLVPGTVKSLQPWSWSLVSGLSLLPC